MKKFLDENFLLKTSTAQRLYHEFAQGMPILDYHCHLPPKEISEDHQFENLTQAWLYGDHYKWRAMRTHGISEEYCTGTKPDREKFQKWAETVPFTVRNPLYHWTHLELRRYFGIEKILDSQSANEIYEQVSEWLGTEDYSVKNLLRKMNVQVVCTTDDPLDSLEFHSRLKKDKFEISVLPAFRPDRALEISDPVVFLKYIRNLEAVANISIHSFDDFSRALKTRHDFFASMGCRISDHGLEQIYAEEFTESEVKDIFQNLLQGKPVSIHDQHKFKSALLLLFAEWDWEKGWVQQFHLGALRNNNSRMAKLVGRDTGHDSIGDFSQATGLSRFLDKLDGQGKLTKTILYNLNPSDNELIATMIGNFNDGSFPGKIQWGSAWWFLDQKDGMTRQLNTLSNMSLLSRFIGMITDSRSFLSLPRHEYFRRVLCDLLGDDMENGELPNDIEWIGQLICDICYHNALNYFDWQDLSGNKGAP